MTIVDRPMMEANRDWVQTTSPISWSTRSSNAPPAWRMTLKSVRKYRSRVGRGNADRPLQSSRSHGSGMSTAALCLPEVDLRHLPGVGRRLEKRIFLEAEHLRRH